MTSDSSRDGADSLPQRGPQKARRGHGGHGPRWLFNPYERWCSDWLTTLKLVAALNEQVVAGSVQPADLEEREMVSFGNQHAGLRHFINAADPDALTYGARPLVDADLVIASTLTQPANMRSLTATGNDLDPSAIALLAEQVLHDVRQQAAGVPIYGLLLSGGESRRMGHDKALMTFQGETQLARGCRLLSSVCDQVYLSCRPGQPDREAILGDLGLDPTRARLDDNFLGMGPLGGILTAQQRHPEAAWLVLACDLPMVSASTLDALLVGRDPLRYATAFRSTHDDFPEPLCAIYEPKSFQRFTQFLGLGCICPRKMLINSRIALLEQHDPDWLDNVNRPDDYQEARRKLDAP